MKAFEAETAKADPLSNNLYIDLLDLDNEDLLDYHDTVLDLIHRPAEEEWFEFRENR